MGRRKTHEEFIEDVYNVWNDEMTVISEYQGTLKKVKVRHNSELCGGHEYEVRPSDLLSSVGCRKCKDIKNRNKRGKTIDEVKYEIKLKFGGSYDVLSDEYKSKDVDLYIKHNSTHCNKIFSIKRRNYLYLKGELCPYCRGNKNVSDVRGGGLSFSDEYIHNACGEDFSIIDNLKDNNNIRVKHKCGEIFEVDSVKFVLRLICPKCDRGRVYGKKTTEQFKEEVFEMLGDEYKVVSDYSGVKDKIKIKHNNKRCGFHEFYTTPGHFMMKNRGKCPKCNKVNRRTTEDFSEEIRQLYNSEYTVIGEFKNIISEIEVQHNSENCNNYLYEVKPVSLLSGGGQCPICYKVNRSNGESKIEHFLKKLGVKYRMELVLFKSDVGGSPRFDFGLYDNDDVLLGLIEFDGIQHFKNVEFFYSGENDSLKRRLELDNMKNNYARDNGIPLLRIKYDEYFSIDDILINFLSDIGVYDDLKLSET